MIGETLEQKILRFKLLRLMSKPQPENHCPQDTIDVCHTAMRQLWIEIEEQIADLDEEAAAKIRDGMKQRRVPRPFIVRRGV